ncbi:E2F transcription factor-like E2FF [Picochlorum sp. SENEW3]|nr:E2F transcription factor-like E2FF [Picochlorum sp. SENEW3]
MSEELKGNEEMEGALEVVMKELVPDDAGKKKGRRQTLRMLTAHFLGQYGADVGVEIHVDDAAEKLDTVRRRVYDIMAVFAEVGVVSKAGKSKYTWHGQKGAEKVGNGGKGPSSHMKGKNPSSLGGLTRGIMSHLANQPEQSHELDQVAIAVLGLDADVPNLKPKLRRAYDVASVLIALNIVQDCTAKFPQEDNVSHAKPKRCLMWRGVHGIQDAIKEAKDMNFNLSQQHNQPLSEAAAGHEYYPYMQRFFPMPFPAQGGPPVFATTSMNDGTGREVPTDATMHYQQYMPDYLSLSAMSDFASQQNQQGLPNMMPGHMLFPIDIKSGSMSDASGQQYEPQQWMMQYFASMGKDMALPSDAKHHPQNS